MKMSVCGTPVRDEGAVSTLWALIPASATLAMSRPPQQACRSAKVSLPFLTPEWVVPALYSSVGLEKDTQPLGYGKCKRNEKVTRYKGERKKGSHGAEDRV